MQRAWTSLLATILFVVAFAVPAQSQSYTLVPFASGQYFTTSGTIAACNGCLLNAYLSGSSTRRDTYSDTSGTANANPVVLNSAGRATVYLAVGVSYRLVLTDSTGGTTYWDIDPVTAVPSSAGNLDISATAGEALALGDCAYLSDGSGSLTAGRWYQCDADNTYESSTAGLVGLATAAIASGGTGTVRIAGRMTGLSGLTTGEFYYASATAGALTATPPTNQRFIGQADSTTTLVTHGDAGALKIPDSDGTHTLAFITTSNLTNDRRVTINPGDSNRQVTLSGDLEVSALSTINQDVSTTGSPTFVTPRLTSFTFGGAATTGTFPRGNGTAYVASTLVVPNAATANQVCYASATDTVACGGAAFTFNGTDVTTTGDFTFGGGDLISTATSTWRQSTSDGADSRENIIAGGGAGSDTSRGAFIRVMGNEFSGAGGFIIAQIGNVASAGMVIRRSDATDSVTVDGGTGGMTLGAPTGGENGLGTLNAAGDIYKNNTAYTNPDYVFEHFFTGRIDKYKSNEGASAYRGLWPLPALEAYVRTNHRFPQIGDAPMGMFQRGDVALELLEQTTLYLFDHDNRLNKQRDLLDLMLQRMERLEQENAELRARLGRLEPSGADMVAVPAGVRR